MELHPMLDKHTPPNPGLWYVFSANGESPTMRVGHSCLHIKGKNSSDNGKLYVIGGANPSGSFCDAYVLDLNVWQWDVFESPGLRARYEHASFIPECHPNKIYVFAGADQAGNMNDIQILDTETNTWTSANPSGTPPSARTHHTSAVVNNSLIVYSGGHSGVDPVGDRQVHNYDAENNKWSILSLKGDPPKPRHGHVMVAVGNRVFVHGGMAGSTFYDDLHILDLGKNLWTNVKKKKKFPCCRAGHCGVSKGTDIYIFGGMSRDGSLDDMYKYDTLTSIWTNITLDGPPPACRLDFAMCVVDLSINESTPAVETPNLMATCQYAKEILDMELKPDSASSRDSKTESTTDMTTVGNENDNAAPAEEDKEKSETVENNNENTPLGAEAAPCKTTHTFCLVHGGMDTEGEIFDDMLVYLIV